MKLLNLLQFFLVLLLAPAAIAQKELPRHNCRILFFNAPHDAPQKLHLYDGATSLEVELPTMNFSPVYELPSGPLNLRLLPTPPATPEQIPAGAPAAMVSAEVVDFYLLVTSDPDNKVAPVRMQVINAGLEKLKLGQSLWFNLTANTIGGKVGSEKLVIQPGKRAVLDAPAKGNADYLVSLSFTIPGEEHLYPLCETRWQHDPRSRSVVIIHTESGRRTPRVMSFPDYRSPVPKKNTAKTD